ncbi:xanthine dehydrogenase family protein molybdopterin-binding subunit [Pseudonocardia sp. H11422]|uniref:xanthine dehydrogenase family protein molybdopterin-binding subunit n=1 Tax=Pseudonocardia sp. H11422 TaxID=2835866 RepID=UPI001BDCBCFB|nr:xanthine dehydrogenase family protein molybdopterin-binding subunit [Pseudonocardia sp. H11422]
MTIEEIARPDTAQQETAQPKLFGQRVRRVEDPRFLLGRAQYVDDVVLPRTLHAAFVRSEVANGVVRGFDVERARRAPGVHLVLTGEDAATQHSPIRCDSLLPEWQGSEWPALAGERVRYAGETVAIVVAEDRYLAEDAAGLVTVDVQTLPPVLTFADAAALPPLHEGWDSNNFLRRTFETSGFDAAMDAAPHHQDLVFTMARHSGIPIETRGCVAAWNPTNETLVLYTATQIPHLIRTGLADVLGLPEHRIQVIAPDVGGGYGIKGHLFPEEVACCMASMALGRPVKWIEDRAEHFVGAMHSREHTHRVRVGYDDEGVIQALDAEILVDVGAYSVYPWTATMDAGMAAGILPGPYRVHNYRFVTSAVASNKTPLGPYRGVARPASCFSIERTLDHIAAHIGIDGDEVRLRNLIPDDQFPWTSATGLVYDSASPVASLEKVVRMSGYRDRQTAPRPPGAAAHVVRGMGIGEYIEQTAHTYNEFVKRGTPNTFGYETVSLRIDPSGGVHAQISAHSHGQGLETTMAQIICDELALPLEKIRVTFGDTNEVPYGSGTFASRSAVLAGGATRLAAEDLRAQLVRVASHLLEIAEEDLVLRDGKVEVAGIPEQGLTVAALGRLVYQRPDKLPPGAPPMLESSRTYDAAPGTGTFANAHHVAEVEVDLETGHVDVVGYWVVEDCGNMINPLIVDGQVHGGVAQGLGSALLEEMVYSSEGQLLTTTFVDYLMPGATEVPNIEVGHNTTPSPFTISGVKGMGEGGAIAPGAAVAAAVEDAIRRAIGPVSITVLPLKPELVLSYIDAARRAAGNQVTS